MQINKSTSTQMAGWSYEIGDEEYPGAFFRTGQDVSLYRYSSAKHIESSPERFYLNFLDSERTFSKRHRMAGPQCASGFFFSPNPNVAMMEMMFYYNISSLGHSNPVEFLRHESLGNDLVFVEVKFNELKVLDLCDERSAQFVATEFMGLKPLRGRWDAIDYYAHYMSQPKGGGYWEEMFGWHAARNEIGGIAFPSRRALDCTDKALWLRADPWRYTGQQAFNVRRNDEVNSADHVLNQLSAENNIVLFRGQDNVPAMRSYKIHYADGRVVQGENKHFGSTLTELGEVRLQEALKLGLTQKEADRLGLVDYPDHIEMFSPKGFWILPDE